MAAQYAIAKDEIFHILQTQRRRAVLRYLLEHSDQATFQMGDLAEVVAAWEHETTVEELTSDERQRVYVPLYQNHLPKLDNYGIITYNKKRGIVEPTPLLDVFDQYLGNGLNDPDDQLLVVPETGAADPTEAERSKLTSAVSGLFSK